MASQASRDPHVRLAASAVTRRTFLKLAASGAALLGVPAFLGGAAPAWALNEGDGPQCPDGDPGSFTASPPGNAGTFLLFSDVHFDPFADPGLVKALAAAPAGEWRGIFPKSGTGLGPYGKDCDDALFQSFLDDMARSTPRPDFLLYPGDLLCHDFWTLYPRLTGDSTSQGLLSFITKTAEYFLGEVTRRFPDAPLFLALGNNDSFEGDFRIAPRSPYLSATAPLVARLALKQEAGREDFLRTYPEYGCYSAPLPGPGGGRIVVVNDIFWSKRHPEKDQGGPVMDFLTRELERAGRAGEKVWLMTHVPPGENAKASASKFLKKGRQVYDSILTPAWNTALAGLMVKHASTVRASFAGHVHRDEFRLAYPRKGSMPELMMRLGPSISPITGNNPGYQVYTYDRTSLELLDMATHYLDMSVGNPAWAEEYTYSRTYGRGLRASKDWQEMYQGLLTCPERREAFELGYGLRSSKSDQITASTFPIYWDSLALNAASPGAK